MAAIACRPAVLGDAAEILALLIELAPQIPLQVDSLEREEALYALIRNCARSGESWVACDADDNGRIVGFALAERAQHGRHYAEHEVLELRYAAASAAAAAVEDRDGSGSSILTQLIKRLLARMVPVTATVSPHSRSGLPACLGALGFHLVAAPGGDRHYRWEAGTPAP